MLAPPHSIITVCLVLALGWTTSGCRVLWYLFVTALLACFRVDPCYFRVFLLPSFLPLLCCLFINSFPFYFLVTSLLPSLFPCCPFYSLFINFFPCYPPCYSPCCLAALSILFLSTPFFVTSLLPFLFPYYPFYCLFINSFPCYPPCFLATLSIPLSLFPLLPPCFFVLRKSLLLTPCYCLSPCWPVTLLAFWVLINLLWLYS